MAMKLGEALPDADLLIFGDDGPGSVNLKARLLGKKVVLFGLPGAYTRTCTAAHMPSFIRTADDLKALGVDEIICVSVNDPFVMQSWAKETGAEEAGILCLADADGSFTKNIGLDFTAPPVGFFGRSKRYAMIVENGVMMHLNVDEDAGTCNLSAGEAIRDILTS